MIRIASFIRRATFPGAVRGPKKKKGQTKLQIESTDIVNIFKDRSDPEVLQVEHYPIYVQELSRGAHSFQQFTLGIMHNQPYMMPGRANYNGYLKAWKRQRTKALGAWRHLDHKPDIMSDNDITTRRAIFAIGQLGKEEQAEKRRMEEEAAAAAEQEDDE